nr:hypothetical protein [Tanacetum cinerariifolium]
GEGSGTPTEPHHTPSPEAQQASYTTHSSPILPPVTTASIPTVTPSETSPLRRYTRKTRIAQSSALPPVADEPVSPLRDVSEGEACPTDSSFGADHDRANIAKTSTLPHDSVPRVTSFAADEGKRSGDDASINGRNLDEGEAAAERVSDDTEEMVTVLTSMDASTVLASGVAEVSTSSGSIHTAGHPDAEVPTGSDVVPTAGLIFTTATVIDAQVARELEEQMAREDQRMSKQVARDAEIARIHAEEELHIKIDGLDRSNETVAKYLQEYHQFAIELPFERRIELISDLIRYQDNYAKVKDFRGITFEEIEAKFTTVWKQVKNFILMGLKGEAERFKRKGIRFEQESAKRLKTLEEVLEEVKSPDEVPEEKVHTEGQRSYWKVTRLGGSSASYQFFMDILKHLDREDLNQLWALVNESLSIRPPTSNKEMELWVEQKRLYEPDDEDQLWTHTKNLIHAPVEWKLYDMCGVHQVIFKDKEIFMLVEKDYPLRKGLAIMMISYKLQVETYSKMANDLILKIYKIASSPSQQGAVRISSGYGGPYGVSSVPLSTSFTLNTDLVIPSPSTILDFLQSIMALTDWKSFMDLPLSKNELTKLKRWFGSNVSFHQVLDLIFKLNETTVECTQDILRQRDFLDRFCEVSWVIPTFVVMDGEVLKDLLRFFGTLITKFATSSVLNFALKRVRDMIIKNLDLQPKFNAMMREFWSKSLKRVCASERDSSMMLLEHQDVIFEFSISFRWEKLRREMGSEILPSRDRSRG